jgi:SAM-dependent methyltransferase
VTKSEAFLLAFHARCTGITARAFGRGGSYERLAARAHGRRVLDLACGDGHLLQFLGKHAVGVDRSPNEVARCNGRAVVARAQALPFAGSSFDVVTCHLAFMLFEDLPHVVGELARVIAPGGSFYALLGGGPTAEGDDAFHAFARMLPAGRRFGDPRASSEDGWRELFDSRLWSPPTFERWELDLSGTFDEVWRFLASSYQLSAHADAERAIEVSIERSLRARWPGDHVPCRVATYLAQVTRT